MPNHGQFIDSSLFFRPQNLVSGKPRRGGLKSQMTNNEQKLDDNESFMEPPETPYLLEPGEHYNSLPQNKPLTKRTHAPSQLSMRSL